MNFYYHRFVQRLYMEPAFSSVYSATLTTHVAYWNLKKIYILSGAQDV